MEGFSSFWATSDGVGRLVALLLLAMSVSSWVTICWKAWVLRRARRDIERAVQGQVQRAHAPAHVLRRGPGAQQHRGGAQLPAAVGQRVGKTIGLAQHRQAAVVALVLPGPLHVSCSTALRATRDA